MKLPNWGQLFADVAKAVAKAVSDVEHNRPPLPGTSMSDAQKLAQVKALATHLPAFIALLEKYQVGFDDVLEALRKNGVSWAGDVEAFLNELPHEAGMLEKWLPTIEWALAAFQPAPSNKPTGII